MLGGVRAKIGLPEITDDEGRAAVDGGAEGGHEGGEQTGDDDAPDAGRQEFKQDEWHDFFRVGDSGDAGDGQQGNPGAHSPADDEEETPGGADLGGIARIPCGQKTLCIVHLGRPAKIQEQTLHHPEDDEGAEELEVGIIRPGQIVDAPWDGQGTPVGRQ